MWSALGALALLASGVVVWRVLRPAEVVTKSVVAYPSPAVSPTPGPLGALVSSPLIVDGRLRVYAAQRQIQADDQPNYRYETSPFWSYRRWPQQLIGVVHPLPGTTRAVPLVIGSWSDGALIALDARTGLVAWRTDGEVLGDEYPGRRTGSTVVWTPRGLLTGVAGGRAVVVGAGDKLSSYDGADGRTLWSTPDAGCVAQAFTVPGAVVVPDQCDGATALLRFDLLSGARTEHPIAPATAVLPLGCRIGASECDAVRVRQRDGGASAWLWQSDGTPHEARGLATASAWLAGDTAVDVPGGNGNDAHAVAGRDPVTGTARWTWNGGGGDSSAVEIIAATPERVLVMTRARTLLAIDPADGSELSRTSVIMDHDPKQPYVVGPVFTAGPYVAIERLKVDAATADTDDEYYYTNRPVLLTAV